MLRDDRMLLLTRLTFSPLAVLSMLFGPLLFLLPNQTDIYFSWTITPAMSAVFIGAGYISGALAIFHLLRLGHWHPMRPFALGGWGFIGAIFAATVLHWDRFHHGTVFFYIWLLVYAVGPFIVPVAVWQNERHNRPPTTNDVMLARPLRLGLAVIGIFFTLLGIILFIWPTLFIPIWPWTLTPLIARVIAAWIFLPGMGAAAALFEARYTAYRPLMQLSLVWAILVLIGSLFHLSDFDFSRPMAWIWFLYLIVITPVVVGVYFYHERQDSLRPQVA